MSIAATPRRQVSLAIINAAMIIAACIWAGAATQAQSPALGAAKAFEEASVRPCDPDALPEADPGARGGGPNTFQMTPGRTHAQCMTLATLIRAAYGYGPSTVNPGGRRSGPWRADVVYGLGIEDALRVRGGPDWVRGDRYTIDAVADGPADAETMSGAMLQSLLERRFGLKVHIETEQIPAFELTIAPGGLKIEGACTPPGASYVQPPTPAQLVRRNLDTARRGATTLAPCQFAGALHGPNLVFVGSGAGVPALSGVLGVQVIDRTGIPATTRFNYVLEFRPDDRTRGPLAARLNQDTAEFQAAIDPAAVSPDRTSSLRSKRSSGSGSCRPGPRASSSSSTGSSGRAPIES